MAQIQIPPQYRTALVGFVKMPDATAESIVSVFRNAGPTSTPKQIAQQVGSSINSLPASELTTLVHALVSLSAFRLSTNKSIEEVVSGVAENLASLPESLPSEDVLRRIEPVLRLPYLAVSSKAAYLKRDHQQILMDINILSDIRPVFEDDFVKGAVIVHTLKATYNSDSEVHSLFLAMDDGDLTALKKAIIRAETKSKVLRTFVEGSGLVVFDVQEAGD